ncbi:hypothetical protein [Secundilactobacillus silagei]|nr:hypothetical protein [Secundilactobacillus silagei]
MAFQTHYNFGGAKTHNGGSKSAAKKNVEAVLAVYSAARCAVKRPRNR